MNDQSQNLLQSIKGPVIMITVGVLFAADSFTDYHFHQTWPVLMIVVGVMQLLVGRRRRPNYYPPPPQAGSGQAPYTGQGQSYPPPPPPSTGIVPAPATPAPAEGNSYEEPRS